MYLSMQNTDSVTPSTSNRQAAIYGLAIFGFITLVGAGILLAVYAARYVPATVSRLNTAAVVFTELFTPAQKPSMSVVEDAPTTIPFGTESATTTATNSATTKQSSTPSNGAPAKAGEQTSAVYTVGTGVAPQSALFGFSDLSIVITSIGYLESSDPKSFVEGNTVPKNKRPAVKFTVKNIGTNTTGTWRFTANIPTKRDYTFRSPSQQSLAPQESIVYTLGFDQADAGKNQPITITVDSERSVRELNEENNNISARIDIN